MRNDDHHPTCTIDEFCAAERISRSKLYELSNERRGPALFPHRNAQAHHRTSAPRLAPTARGRSDGQHRRHADHADFEEWRQVMGWRDKYKMHPSAGVFPMMEGEELTNLVKDITEKGLKTPARSITRTICFG